MKKAAARTGMMILFLINLSGCGPEAVVLPDIAFTMGFDQYDEPSLAREFPDLQRLLDSEGFRTSLFWIDPSNTQWEAELSGESASLFLWAPLRGHEAVRFHREHPETTGMWLSLKESRLTDSAPENLRIMIPRREQAWNQLNSVLNKEGYRRIAGILSAAAVDDPGADVLISENLEWFFPLDGSDDPSEALEFMKNHVSGKADFIVLAAGEANSQLYQELKHWQVPMFLEAPFPGAESNPSVKGLFVVDWAEGFKTVWKEEKLAPKGFHSINSRLWWRTETALQPLE